MGSQRSELRPNFYSYLSHKCDNCEEFEFVQTDNRHQQITVALSLSLPGPSYYNHDNVIHGSFNSDASDSMGLLRNVLLFQNQSIISSEFLHTFTILF